MGRLPTAQGLPGRSDSGADGSRPPTSAAIGGRDPRSRAATAEGEFPRTGLTLGIAEPACGPPSRLCRLQRRPTRVGLGCPPGTGRLCRPRPGAVRNERAWPARSQHPPRQDLAWAISAGLRGLDRTDKGAAARARPQDEGRVRRRRRCAKAALRESGGVARAAVYWSKIFCSTPPPRRFRRARPSWARGAYGRRCALPLR